jgi:hypothetical protein
MARRGPETLVGSLLISVLWTAATAQVSDPSGASAQLASILERVTISASSGQQQQIVDAIAASPLLSSRFGELAANGKLTAIDVVEARATGRASGPFAAAPPVKGAFAAALDGSKIVLSSQLLSTLRNGRLVDTPSADDVYPNQTVFVLAHLAYHLGEPISPMPKPGEDVDSFTARRLESEANAYIHAWNATVDEAVHRRGGSALSADQVTSLELNCRYRFALLGIRSRNIAGPAQSPSGIIEPTPSNVEAVVQTLRQSAIADLE